jgi:hypothetical protein
MAAISENFENLVVSMDDVSLGNKEGIFHAKAWDFVAG